MSPRRLRRVRRQRKGQSLVEFALMLPILLMVMFAIGGFAVLFYAYLTLNLAVREGASSLVHNPKQTVSTVQATVLSTMATLDPSQIRVDVQPSDPATWLSGVSIAVTGFYTVGTPLAAYGPIKFQAQSIMTIE
jgi:Flp pilus assembly protein TadG